MPTFNLFKTTYKDVFPNTKSYNILMEKEELWMLLRFLHSHYNGRNHICCYEILDFRITLSLDINGVILAYTTVALAAATTNCLPVITFFLAVLL
ncbi:hypothetical protein J1N35_005496, partial [Gossypium stocksii]